MTFHYTRSKAHRPNIPASEEGDVGLTTSPPLLLLTQFRRPPPKHQTTPVRSSVAAAGETESMATESAGPVSIPPLLLQTESLPPGADPVHQDLRVLFKWGFPWDTPAV